MCYNSFTIQGSEPVVMLVDGNSAMYPLARDCVGMVREPPPLNLAPARALAAHALPLHPHAPHHHQAALKSQVRHTYKIYIPSRNHTSSFNSIARLTLVK